MAHTSPELDKALQTLMRPFVALPELSILPTRRKARRVLALDSSQIALFLNCPQKWFWRYHMHLVKSGESSKALDKGTYLHFLCDLFYTVMGLTPSASRIVVANSAMEFLNAKQLDLKLTREEKQSIMVRFFQYVTNYTANDFAIITSKGIPAVELGFSKVLYEDDDYLFVVEGRIDALARQHDRNYFVDHKSQGRKKDLYQFRPQFLTYAWATGFNWGLINYIGLQKTVEPYVTFRRKPIYFHDWQIREWEKTMLRVFFKIANGLDTFEVNPTLENGDSEFFRDRSACEGMYGWLCAYHPLCDEEHQSTRKLIQIQEYKKSIWKPWESKEIIDVEPEEV